MKFLTLEQGQLGGLIDEQVVDLTEAARLCELDPVPQSLTDILDWDDQQLSALHLLGNHAVENHLGVRPWSDVTPLAPIPEPRRNILCLGKNYRDHAQEVAEKMKTADVLPEAPIIFTKAPSAVIGPGDTIPSHPELTRKLDYEAELALIIGRGGRDIKPEDAWGHVFGYTIINDVSARDLQKSHVQWFRAKSLDGFAPMGPVVVPRRLMPEVADIEICCYINGELRQQSTLDYLIFDIPTIIATLSSGMTLVPGDIIATGTPAGVGMGFKPSRYLQSGDKVVITLTGAGELENLVD